LVEGEDTDADGRTQQQGKGAGASSCSERGTHKARSRKSAKSDSKEKDREKDKEWKRKDKDKRKVRDDDATRLRHTAKGHVVEWLGNLETPEPVPEPVLPAMGKTISKVEKDGKAWDSNTITPGTPFMELLTKSLWYWVVQN
jgi:5'-3' exonuclease